MRDSHAKDEQMRRELQRSRPENLGQVDMDTPTEVLERFLGVSEQRVAILARSYSKIVAAVLAPSIFGTTIGFLFYYYLTKVDYPTPGEGNTHAGWPKIPAVTVVLATLGGALSFLLVFQLTWAFGGWKSAKHWMGSTTALLKQLIVLLDTAGPDRADEELDALDSSCRWFCAAIVISLKGRPAEDETYREHDKEARRRVVRAHLRLGKHVESIKQLEQKEGKDITDVYGRAYCIHETLLLNYTDMKRLTTQKMPALLGGLTRYLTYAYVCLIFPLLLAYAFVMDLNDTQVDSEILWEHRRSHIFIVMYLASCLLASTYFVSLMECGRVLLNPVGWDATDVQLEDWFGPFIEDLVTLREARHEAGRSQSIFNRMFTIPADDGRDDPDSEG
mmetsp:Transcript_21475/g.64270  ORF Transcript_21475/g.64270 Transcript_21475/m.64270 type:complete len:390 (+) Transcript_21475:1012-2181(+)